MVGGGATTERPLTDHAHPLAEDGVGREDGLPADVAGLYGPSSEAWRLNREAALLLGAGPRALLLQVAHPLVAEGVAAHSHFREDPWGRLAGTLRSYLRIVYGTAPAARAEIARLSRLHASVTGPVVDPDGRLLAGTYQALDPVLELWVHATLVDSTLVAVDRWLEPLAAEVRARFYAETVPVARLFGVPDDMIPAHVDAFDAYMRGMLGPDGPVHPTATSRDLADAILRPPLNGVVRSGVATMLGAAVPAARMVLDLVPPPAVTALLVPAIGLLPPETRAEYGLAWGPRERLVDAWLTGVWRLGRPLFPTSLRWFPQAQRADARVAARTAAR